MPPWPSGAPACRRRSPGRPGVARCRACIAAAGRREAVALERASCSSSSAARSAASAGSSARKLRPADRARARRSRSSTSSSKGLSARQRCRSRSVPHHARPRIGRGSSSRRTLCRIDARLFPVALHRALRHAAHRRDLGEREAAEELQVDDLGQRRIDASPAVERIAMRANCPFVGSAGSATSVSSDVISNWPPRFWRCRCARSR